MNLTAFANSMNRKANNQKIGTAGFTLIELMICLSVIAILGCAAVPSFKGYQHKSGLKSAAFQLALDLVEAKSLAIKNNRSCQVALDPNTNQYTISLDGRSVALSDYSGAVQFATDPSGRVPFSSSMTFTGRGLCNPGGQVFLTNAQKSAVYRILASVAGGISTQVWNSSTGTWN
jgi:prepilin-type N-terminal cleavage/methylation domain-containing protein